MFVINVFLPKKLQIKIDSRFINVEKSTKKSNDEPAFDMVRASVNLMVASILIAIDLSLHENVSVGIDLTNLSVLGHSLYYFLLAELSSLTQVHFEKYRQHQYYDLILTTTKKAISVKDNYYYMSEFLSAYDIAQIKSKIKAIKHQKNNR